MKYSITTLALLCCVIISCTKDKLASDEESKLYQLATGSDFTWYKNDPVIRASSSSSGHSGFFRVRFNHTAFSAFDSTGKLPVGSTFPDSSIVVKELFSSPSESDRKEWAVMQKNSASSNAVNGWVWAEFESDGLVKYSTSNKGSGCKGCHSATGNRDFVRVFDLFP